MHDSLRAYPLTTALLFNNKKLELRHILQGRTKNIQIHTKNNFLRNAPILHQILLACSAGLLSTFECFMLYLLTPKWH